MNTYFVLYLIIHLVCGILAAGIFFAYLQAKYPDMAQYCRTMDLKEAWLFGLVSGPFGLITVFFKSDFAQHGLRWR